MYIDFRVGTTHVVGRPPVWVEHPAIGGKLFLQNQKSLDLDVLWT